MTSQMIVVQDLTPQHYYVYCIAVLLLLHALFFSLPL